MKVGLVKDESEKYDGYNWHDVYAKEFKSLGDEVVFLDFKKRDWLNQVETHKPDLIMWRAWHRPDDRDNARAKIQIIERFFNIPIFPNWDMYYSYDNKIIQNFILNKLKFSIPETWIFYDKNEALSFVNKAKFPLVSKCSEGACGDNVYLIKNQGELKNYIEECFSEEGTNTYFPWVRQKGYVYLQEFIEGDRDLRIITIGDKVELAFWRENKNSWKHNIAGGGSIDPGDIPKEAKSISLDLARKLRFHWCAFDIILKEDKPLILEFSSIFGFSRSGHYENFFGSPNAFILKKQAEYLHRLFLK